MSPRFSGTIIDNKVHSTFLSSDKKNNLKSPLLSDTSPNIVHTFASIKSIVSAPIFSKTNMFDCSREYRAESIDCLTRENAVILRRAPGEYFLLGWNPLRNSLFLAQYRIKLKTLTWSGLHTMFTVLTTIFKVIHALLSSLAARGDETARKAEGHFLQQWFCTFPMKISPDFSFSS